MANSTHPLMDGKWQPSGFNLLNDYFCKMAVKVEKCHLQTVSSARTSHNVSDPIEFPYESLDRTVVARWNAETLEGKPVPVTRGASPIYLRHVVHRRISLLSGLSRLGFPRNAFQGCCHCLACPALRLESFTLAQVENQFNVYCESAMRCGNDRSG